MTNLAQVNWFAINDRKNRNTCVVSSCNNSLMMRVVRLVAVCWAAVSRRLLTLESALVPTVGSAAGVEEQDPFVAAACQYEPGRTAHHDKVGSVAHGVSRPFVVGVNLALEAEGVSLPPQRAEFIQVFAVGVILAKQQG